MARYRVHEDVTAEVHHFMLGACQATFAAGEVEPKNEQETLVLDSLVTSGHATLVEADPPRDPAAPVEPEQAPEATAAEQPPPSEQPPAEPRRTRRART